MLRATLCALLVTYGPPVTTSMDHLAALAHRTLSHQNIGVPPSIVREQRRVTYGD
jgi:hypothetical protein